MGHLADGSPLRVLLAQLPGDAGQRVQDALALGVAAGQGSTQIAETIRGELDGNLTRALTISRTETVRAYRAASHRSYGANADVLEGWIWHAALGPRSCACCVAMHGTLHEIEETLDGHPCCRCVPIPWIRVPDGVAGTRKPVETGAAWFARQDAATQEAVLGKAAHEAYRAGEVRLEDFVGRRHSDRWGSMRYARSLKDARAAATSKREFPGPPWANPRRPAIVVAQSHQDVEVWARANIPGLRHVDYSGMDLDVANEVNRVVSDIATKFGVSVPAIAPFDWPGWQPPFTVRATMATTVQGIGYDPLVWQDPHKTRFLEQLRRRMTDTDASRNVPAYVAHEMAHILHLQPTGTTRQQALGLIAPIVQQYRLRMSELGVRAEIGAYAWTGGISETWAEGFSAYWEAIQLLQPATREMVERVLNTLFPGVPL